MKDATIVMITVTDTAKLRTIGRVTDTDLVISGDKLRGLTAAVCLNRTPKFRHRFGTDTRLAITQLPTATDVMYIGIELTGAMPSTTDNPPGFQLLVGIDPTHPTGSEVEMLFIVGE